MSGAERDPEPLNPYTSQSHAATESATPNQCRPLPATSMQYLRRTRGWLIWLGLLGFVLAGLGAFSVGGVFVRILHDGQWQRNPSLATGPVLFAGLAMLLTLLPSLLLWRCAGRIGSFVERPSGERLNAALAANRLIWQVMGIVTIVLLVLYFGILVLGVIFMLSAR